MVDRGHFHTRCPTAIPLHSGITITIAFSENYVRKTELLRMFYQKSEIHRLSEMDHGDQDDRILRFCVEKEIKKRMQLALAAMQINACAQTTTTIYQPTSPPITTSPPRTAPEPISWLMECGTTPAVIGNSTGLVFTMRITLPAPGVSRMQKNGRSQPSSVYSSMTCLLLLGPWRSSILALSGRPSVLRRTSTLSTVGSKGYVRRAPPWMVEEAEMASPDGVSTFPATALAAIGNSIWPMLRTQTV